jgi:hypothetical protein
VLRVCEFTKSNTTPGFRTVFSALQTTERYLGCEQRIRSAVNDRIGIEPNL